MTTAGVGKSGERSEPNFSLQLCVYAFLSYSPDVMRAYLDKVVYLGDTVCGETRAWQRRTEDLLTTPSPLVRPLQQQHQTTGEVKRQLVQSIRRGIGANCTRRHQGGCRLKWIRPGQCPPCSHREVRASRVCREGPWACMCVCVPWVVVL